MNRRISVYMVWDLEKVVFFKVNFGIDCLKWYRENILFYVLREYLFLRFKGEEVCSFCVIMLMLLYYVI